MFNVSGEKYERFMGRWSSLLAPKFADFAGVTGSMRVVDVGCGPGVLTVELARRVGGGNVAAIDPQPSFVEATRTRVPEADTREGAAEGLPWGDETFDAALAQLVVAFMSDPVAGVREMRRVTREGGTVAFAMWDIERFDLLGTFWRSARAAGLELNDPEWTAYRTQSELEELADAAGLGAVQVTSLAIEREYADFDDFWEPFTYEIGPVGTFYKQLDGDQKAAMREEARKMLGDPQAPFVLHAQSWAARGTA